MKFERKQLELFGVEVTLTQEHGKNRYLSLKADNLNSCAEICFDKEEVEALRELLNSEINQD